MQDYFKETYGRETHFIPNGVNRPQIREASLITDKFGLKKDSYILFLGRLVPEKGIRYLVEAFKNVKTDKKLVIAGGSSDTDSFMEELKELAKGDDRILFTGFVQGAMLDELYSNAYIYTLPSDLEGMPLSLLEAMSYGNCCLVSDIPECAEVVEDIVAAYIRLYPKKWYSDNYTVSICLIVSVILSWISVVVLAFICFKTGKEIQNCYYFVSDSNKLLALSTAVFSFLFFDNIKMKYHKFINVVAASTFGVLQIHTSSDTMRTWLWKTVCDNVGAYDTSHWLLHVVVCVVMVFFCVYIDRYCENKYFGGPFFRMA